MDGTYNFDMEPALKLLESLPVTPERGQPMPQTQAYWQKRALMDQELILEQKAEIERLKQTVNQLRQKINLS